MSAAPDALARLLQTEDAELEGSWSRLAEWIRTRFGREATVESALFLVGIQTRGRGFTDRLSKEEKQDLIMEGTWRVLHAAGLARRDAAGWERLVALPDLDIPAQEKLLRAAIVRYFADHLAND